MIELAVTPREDANGKPVKAKHLRAQGLVPVGIQQRGKPTVMGTAPVAEFRAALRDSHGHKLNIRMGKAKPFEVLVKEVQHEGLTRTIQSVTFQRVSETDVVKMTVSLIPHGIPEEVDNRNAIISYPTTTVELKGILKDLPDELEFDTSQMGATDKLTAADLKLPDGVELISSGDAVIATTQIAPKPADFESIAEHEAESAGADTQPAAEA